MEKPCVHIQKGETVVSQYYLSETILPMLHSIFILFHFFKCWSYHMRLISQPISLSFKSIAVGLVAQ